MCTQYYEYSHSTHSSINVTLKILQNNNITQMNYMHGETYHYFRRNEQCYVLLKFFLNKIKYFFFEDNILKRYNKRSTEGTILSLYHQVIISPDLIFIVIETKIKSGQIVVSCFYLWL